MNRTIRILLFCILILLGIVMLGYGAFVHSADVLPQKEDGSPALARSEPALIKEASVGGVRLDESGNIKQTYTGAAPKECAT